SGPSKRCRASNATSAREAPRRGPPAAASANGGRWPRHCVPASKPATIHPARVSGPSPDARGRSSTTSREATPPSSTRSPISGPLLHRWSWPAGIRPSWPIWIARFAPSTRRRPDMLNEQLATSVGPSRLDIAYERRGNLRDPVVLLVMGVAAQLVNWPEGFVDALVSRELQVIRFDNRDA